jgi:hypothetical protein
MKNMLRCTGLIVSFVLLLMAFNVFGQSGVAVRWNIPFEFMLGERVMPAGEYITRPVWVGSNNKVLLMSNPESGKAAFIYANPQVNPRFDGNAKLVFLQSEEGYALSQISDSTGVRAIALSQSKSGNMADGKHKSVAMNSKQVIVKAL